MYHIIKLDKEHELGCYSDEMEAFKVYQLACEIFSKERVSWTERTILNAFGSAAQRDFHRLTNFKGLMI